MNKNSVRHPSAIFAILVLASSSFCGSYQIDLASNDWPQVVLPVTVPSSSDTLSFSNGIRIYRVEHGMDTPEINCHNGAIKFDTSTVSQLGYRFSPDLTTSQFPSYPNSCYTQGGGDSVWENASQYPDSLYPLDTTNTSASKECLIWVYRNDGVHRSACPGGYWGAMVPYGNSIIYAKSKTGSHMKLQVFKTHIYCFTLSSCGPTEFCPLDSIYIRWDSDSDGNGTFSQSSEVLPLEHRGKPACKTVQRIQAIHILGDNADHNPVYDIMGNRLTSTRDACARAVYIMFINPSNTMGR